MNGFNEDLKKNKNAFDGAENAVLPGQYERTHVTAKFNELGYELLIHSSYAPDSAVPDYFLFQKFKHIDQR